MNKLEQIKLAIIARLKAVADCGFKRGDELGDFTKLSNQIMFEDGSQSKVIKQIGGDTHYLTHICSVTCGVIKSEADEAFAQLGDLTEQVKTNLMTDVDLGGLVDIFYLENYESQGDASDADHLAEMSFDIIFEYCATDII